MKEYIIPEITAEAVCNCLEALGKKDGDLKYLSKYINKTETYTRRAVLVGLQINLIKSNVHEFQLTAFASILLKKTEGRAILLKAIADYNIEYTNFDELKEKLNATLKKEVKEKT